MVYGHVERITWIVLWLSSSHAFQQNEAHYFLRILCLQRCSISRLLLFSSNRTAAIYSRIQQEITTVSVTYIPLNHFMQHAHHRLCPINSCSSARDKKNTSYSIVIQENILNNSAKLLESGEIDLLLSHYNNSLKAILDKLKFNKAPYNPIGIQPNQINKIRIF